MAERVFTCQRCGHCCLGEGGIVLARHDQERLAEHLGLDRENFLQRCAERRAGKLYLKTGEHGYCLFYSEGCSVHPARPDVCRAWPFFRGNLLDELSFAMAREDCPGISQDAAHADFVREGLAVLRDEGLCSDEEEAGRALCIDWSEAD
jgi:hypothetical protein